MSKEPVAVCPNFKPTSWPTEYDFQMDVFMLPPNCSTRHARSFKVSKTSHLRGSLTLKLPHANFANWAVSWIVAQSPPVTKLARRRKLHCFCHIQPKGQARHQKSLMHRYHHAQMMSTIFQLMKTIGKSTSVPESTANPGSSPTSRFGRNAHQATSTGTYSRVWWSEKHYWADWAHP